MLHAKTPKPEGWHGGGVRLQATITWAPCGKGSMRWTGLPPRLSSRQLRAANLPATRPLVIALPMLFPAEGQLYALPYRSPMQFPTANNPGMTAFFDAVSTW